MPVNREDVETLPTRGDTVLRWSAGLIAAASTVAVAVWCGTAADTNGFWRALRDGLRADGYMIIVVYLAAVLLGAAIQTPPALRRGARVRAGWLAVAGLLGYGLVVALLAWLLASGAPEVALSPRRRDPGALYPAWLVSVLLGYALVVLSGAVFVPRTGLRPQRTQENGPPARTRRRMQLPGILAVTSVLSWMIGLPMLVLLGIAVLVTSSGIGGWVPAGGLSVLLVCVIGAVGLAVLAITRKLLDLSARSGDEVRLRGASTGLALTVALGLAGFGAAASQLGRVLPGGVMLVLAVALLVALVPLTSRLVGRRAAPVGDQAEPAGDHVGQAGR